MGIREVVINFPVDMEKNELLIEEIRKKRLTANFDPDVYYTNFDPEGVDHELYLTRDCDQNFIRAYLSRIQNWL